MSLSKHFCTVFILLLAQVSFACAAKPVARPSTSGKLHVVGTELYDQNGNRVVLRGVSTHGLAWFPQYVNNKLFHQLSKEWNTNLIRLAMYSDDYVNGDRKKNLEVLRKGVEYAIENDMYVMVDWHILTDNNPNINLAEAINFFNEMAKEYANIIIPVIRRHMPTLPQYMRLGNGYVDNFWKNLGHRLVVK